MHRKYCTYIFLLLLGLTFQACMHTMNPRFYSPQFGPRMIQPAPQVTNVNALPDDPNFTQSYHNYRKSKTNSRMGALVRIIEFEYDIDDSFSIIPRMTTGFDEGEMTGLLTIMIDQYELTYENPNPQIREYVEEVSYESSRPVQQTQQTYNAPTSNIIVNANGRNSAVYNNIQEKQSQVINRSQLYNSVKYTLEDEDVNLLLRTKTLSYIVHLQNSTLTIFPSKEQIRVLKRMIQKYYRQ